MSALRLTIVFALTLSLIVFPGSVVTVRHARADLAPAAPSDPSTQWVPAGPMADKILITTYSDENTESNALKGNTLDLTDWGLSIAEAPSTCPAGSTAILCDSRFYVGGPTADTGMEGVESSGVFSIIFNHANTFFGINFGFGRDTNADNLKAIHFRQGIAHLVSKQDVVASQFGTLANAIDNPLPPGQGIPHSGLPFDTTCQPVPTTNCNGPYSNGGYNLGGACSWDTLDAQFRAAGQTCRSAFKYGLDTVDSAGVVTASAANPDFCDAADHWIAAGLATGRSTTDCHLTGLSSALSSGNIHFVLDPIRYDLPRLNLGGALASRMCELINGAGVTMCSQIQVRCLGGFGCFGLPVTYATDVVHLDWHMYLDAWGAGPTPEQVWRFYNSQFAGSACGGPSASFGTNYVYFCNSRFDKYNSMVEFNSTAQGSIASLQVANDMFGNHTVSIPLYSQSSRYAYVKGWTGVSQANGRGLPNRFALMNVWNSHPATVGTVRFGFIQGIFNPNPMSVVRQWDGLWNSLVYDSLLATNPYSPTDIFGWMVNQWSILPPQPGDPFGTVSDVKFNLRNDMFFHDGIQVTASDVLFSWLAFNNHGNRLGPMAQGIIGVRVQNDFNFIISLNSNSIFALFNAGGFPIIPQHILAAAPTTKCTDPATPACTIYSGADTADLVALHQFIGSGPYACLDLTTGQVGGKCSATGSGSVPFGSSIVLTRDGFGQAGTANSAYFRDGAKYAQWQWANPLNHIQVDILDVSSAAACFGMPATGSCAHWDTPAARISCVQAAGSCNTSSMAGLGGNSDGMVELLEVQQVFRWFETSWNSPFSYSALSSPTGCAGTGCGAQLFPQTLYEGGIVYAIIP